MPPQLVANRCCRPPGGRQHYFQYLFCYFRPPLVPAGTIFCFPVRVCAELSAETTKFEASTARSRVNSTSKCAFVVFKCTSSRALLVVVLCGGTTTITRQAREALARLPFVSTTFGFGVRSCFDSRAQRGKVAVCPRSTVGDETLLETLFTAEERCPASTAENTEYLAQY